ncbi:MAG: hypothetical protein KBD05_02565 [Candidatus Pacebacteria bacterium]|nr:hypothetical protein [Candidatus Paceibacterota bacterium]MBP9816887.1 hypothetical protein [Candidatus Paceibacterota bacterium]
MRSAPLRPPCCMSGCSHHVWQASQDQS